MDTLETNEKIAERLTNEEFTTTVIQAEQLNKTDTKYFIQVDQDDDYLDFIHAFELSPMEVFRVHPSYPAHNGYNDIEVNMMNGVQSRLIFIKVDRNRNNPQ